MHDVPLPEPLSDGELVDLVQRVFAPREDESQIALLIDFPDQHTPDDDAWRARRRLLLDWHRRLAAAQQASGLACLLYGYRNVRANNADLPATANRLDDAVGRDGNALDLNDLDLGNWHADDLDRLPDVPFEELLADIPIFMAATHFSATAPLKLMSARHGCRAATMPGFHACMVDALRLDYGEVDRQVRELAARLSAAQGADFRFRLAAGSDAAALHQLHLDLRHRHGHASGGLVRQPGQAGNLPSGEAYIVPYEGEVSGETSRSEGVLPVELEGEVVLYRIVENRAVEVISDGPVSTAESQKLSKEPAYGNMAELGLGVLAGFGVQPVGTLLLDEKLGLHIAFGRSDHFGGQVGAKDFSSPGAVVHIDRVYLPQTQPLVQVEAVDLQTADGTEPLMRHGRYVS